MANSLSHNTIREMLRVALTGSDPKKYVYIQDVFDDSVVYSGDDQSTYSRSFKIDSTTLAVTLGEATKVIRTTSYQPAKFESEIEFSNDSSSKEWVIYEGPIFETGQYPDKGIDEVNTDYLDTLVRNFTAQDVNIAHRNTPITHKQDGTPRKVKVARLSNAWRDGRQLMGRVEVAKWFHDNLLEPGEKLGVSVEIHPKEIRLDGLALTNNPRISDAKIAAAFAEFEAGDGSRKGGVMDLWTRVKGLFSKEEMDQIKAEVAGMPPTAPQFSAGGNDSELQKQLAAAQAQAKSAEEARLRDRAAAFADECIKSGSHKPESRDGVITLFCAAVREDAGGKALFSEDFKFEDGAAMKALVSIMGSAAKADPTGETRVFAVAGAEGGGSAAFSLDTNQVWKDRDNPGGAKSGS